MLVHIHFSIQSTSKPTDTEITTQSDSLRLPVLENVLQQSCSDFALLSKAQGKLIRLI